MDATVRSCIHDFSLCHDQNPLTIHLPFFNGRGRDRDHLLQAMVASQKVL